MADPLSSTTSIITLIDICVKIISYARDVKDGSSERARLMMEIFSTKGILECLIQTVKDADRTPAAWSQSIRSLKQQNGPLEMLQEVLVDLHDELHQAVSARGAGRIGHGLLWPFKKKVVEERLRVIDRQKTLLMLALDNDHVALSREIHGDTRAIRNDVTAVKADITQRKDREHRDSVLNWLSKVNYALQQHDYIGRRQPGTGEWLLSSDEYQLWLQSAKNTLFCPGIPGAGKTILASVVVEDLTKRFVEDTTIGLAYIYFNFRRHDEQGIEDLLANLLKQLAQRQPALPECIKALHGRQTRPSIDEISTALHSVCAVYTRCFIVVDALDECSTSIRERFVSSLLKIKGHCKLGIFVTSRFIPDIISRFKDDMTLEIRASNGDIETYLQGCMPQLPSFIHENLLLQAEIKSGISSAVDGMFLLAQIYLSSLDDKLTPKAIKSAIRGFRRLNPASSEDSKVQVLSKAYDEAMERIIAQKQGFKDIALDVLGWITYAKRPITTLELQHALAVEVGEPELDQQNLLRIEDMVSVCAGLVTVDEESNIVRLVHYTTQQYFERTQKWFVDTKLNITNVCIAYLSFDKFKSGFCESDPKFMERHLSNPLYDYASNNWGHHAREAHGDYQAIIQFLEDGAKVEAAGQAIRDTIPPYLGPGSLESCRYLPRTTGLHLAAFFGLHDVANILLQKGKNVDLQDSRGGTPLSWASRSGHEAVVKLLLNEGASIDLKEGYGKTPLALATHGGHKTVVQILLDGGAFVDTIDYSYQTPLATAATYGHFDIISILLNKGVNVEKTDTFGGTSLLIAASNGYEAIVRLLLDIGADIGARDVTGGTPLKYAAKYGHHETVQLLFNRGAATGINAWDGDRALLEAAARGHETIVRLLIENGASIQGNGYRISPLWAAADRGHEAVVRLLIENGATIEDKSERGETPLWAAARSGSTAVVQLLLDRNADIDSKDNLGRTPLSIAARWGREEVILALLRSGDVDLDTRDFWGSMPLSIGARHGHIKVARLLLDTEHVDIDSEDFFGRTPLWYARRYGESDIVQLLHEYAVKTGKPLCQVDIQSKYSSNSPRFGDQCDICTLRLEIGEWLYSCKVCNGGDLGICGDCYDAGARCLGANHRLVDRFMPHQTIFASTGRGV